MLRRQRQLQSWADLSADIEEGDATKSPAPTPAQPGPLGASHGGKSGRDPWGGAAAADERGERDEWVQWDEGG